MKVEKQRTQQQNKAIHKFCADLAQDLNDSGLTMTHSFKQWNADIPWSMETVKEVLFKGVLKKQFGKTSTTQMTTREVNEVFETLAKFLAERLGYVAEFPSVESMSMRGLGDE